jgi:UPF0755 protein
MGKGNASKGFANVSVKLCKYVVMVVIVVVCATTAFNFGSSIFNTEGMEAAPGTDMTLTIDKNTTISELADTLEEYGIIEDTTVFKVQAHVYSVKELKPGTYTFNTSQNSEQIFETLNAGPEENKKENETEE